MGWPGVIERIVNECDRWSELQSADGVTEFGGDQDEFVGRCTGAAGGFAEWFGCHRAAVLDWS
jgi:hypothetical protein